ncbi:MAG: hypothetical protein R3F37_16480 [Candidatus Competibacteraceae bacterium]
MSWPLPDERQLRNIIYHATSGWLAAGSPFASLIRQSRIAQGIAVLNRARQEVSDSPGWGRRELGTEPASDPTSPNLDILEECRVASARARQIVGIFRETVFCNEYLLRGAQMYGHYFYQPPLHWPRDPDTHLVAAYGPMLSDEVRRECLRDGNEQLPSCRGYLGVYVQLALLGRAMASVELGCRPSQVPVGAVRGRWNREVRGYCWGGWLNRQGH